MSTLPNIFPAAKADLFQDNAANTLPEKNGSSSGQFADWMSRALSPGLSAKSPAAGVAEAASAAKTDLFSGNGTDVVLDKNDDNKSQPDGLAPGASTLTASGKLSMTDGIPVSAVARVVTDLMPALPATGTPVSASPKKSKADGKFSDSGHSKLTENQPVANPSALPENLNAVINPEILAAKNPVLPLTLTEGAMNLVADNGAVFQPALPVSKNNSSATGKAIAIMPQSSLPSPVALNLNGLSEVTTPDIAPAVNTAPEISDRDFSQNQPPAGDVSKVQADSRKKAASAGSAPPVAVDSKAAVLTPVAQQIPAATAGVNLKTPKTDVTTPADFSPPEFSGRAVPDEKTIAPTASFADGTLAAKQDGLMGSSEKASKIAVLAGKFLPGNATATSRGNDLASRPEQIFTATAAGAAAQGGSATVAISAATPVENSLAEDVRAQALERAHDAIALHAMGLNSAGTDSLQVVIKPGAGTQLSLELRQRGDGVEVQAVLQQGDFKHLNQQWPELQQRLEQRGIKLTSLVTDGNSANGGNGEMFQQRKSQPENQPAGPVTEMSFAAPLTGVFAKPVARTAAPAGWETWA